jgi:hypothetical protein
LAKKKLRPIVVDGQNYLWGFRVGYKKTEEPSSPFHSHNIFVAYPENNYTSPLRITFIAWEDGASGSPLGTGATVVLGDLNTSGVNLHEPKWAVTLIREGLKRGWQAKTNFSPFIIENGMELLAQLNYIR